MKKTITVNTSSPFVSGALAILLGLLMVTNPGFVVHSFLVIVGWFLILMGVFPIIYSLIKKYPVSFISVIYLIGGILLLIFKGWFLTPLIWIFGIVLILAAIQQFNMFASAKSNGYTIPAYSYLYPAVLLLTGIITIINPFGSLEALVIFAGIALLFYGISTILNRILLKKK